MKTLIIIAISIVGLTLTSCGNVTTTEETTNMDSTSVAVDTSYVELDSVVVVVSDTTTN